MSGNSSGVRDAGWVRTAASCACSYRPIEDSKAVGWWLAFAYTPSNSGRAAIAYRRLRWRRTGRRPLRTRTGPPQAAGPAVVPHHLLTTHIQLHSSLVLVPRLQRGSGSREFDRLTAAVAMSQTVLGTGQPLVESPTLSEAWTRAQRDIHRTQSPPALATPETRVTLHSTALHSLLTLRHLVHAAGALSANDRLSESPTSSLRYLLVPSMLAGVLLSWPGMEGRRGRLEQCMSLWKQLLTTVDVMDGLTEAEERRWRQVKTVVVPEGGEEEAAGNEVGARGGMMDAAQQRQDKIARFKQQREWQQQIDAYEAKQQQQRARKTSSTAITATAVDGDGDEDDVDEEAARQYWLLRLRVAVNAAMDELVTGQQELQFLKERQAREEDPQLREEREREEEDRRRVNDGHRPATYTISSSDQLRNQPIPPHMQAYLQPLPPATDGSNGVAAGAGGAMGGGVVTTLNGLMGRGRREDVFRVVNGPTMSVEEWAEQEMREGRLPTPQQPWRAASREERGYVGSGDREGGAGTESADEEEVGERGGESEERSMDAKRVEERGWDNWKDDHERGAGNRKR